MGRLRNISASFKAAAFPSTSASSSPTSATKPDAFGETKQVSVLERESSSTSLLGNTLNSARLRSASKPVSSPYNPPVLNLNRTEDIEELRPVFSFLSSHSNKLYQEGYFLKLDDLDGSGKPNVNRVWTECFAQLVGTVLSLWDAAALDEAGQDGEVSPSFINLADASIKMIETLPTRNNDVQPLQNVLSISSAGKNRYLLHFNSLHSLTQWTAGIRLSMFENASLQELYTGSLIAGKGKYLNGINQIMSKNKFRVEDWTRVRFGAGTPWRRCWCVIDPPDEKEWQKNNKRMGKRSAYDRPVYPKGDIKFYDTKKTKKAMPIATITDAYSCYAVYPQSKPLINESTLIKLEGKITIHSTPESKTEGFVFVMPEVHPAVTGFEMLLRWLLPVFDTFSLYGRPTRLIPDTLDTRSLMFAMPRERRYGYLDIIDIAALIHTEGSDKWSEREWRKQMKESTSKRMSMARGTAPDPVVEQTRTSTSSRPAVLFGDDSAVRTHRYNQSTDAVFDLPKKTPTAPAALAHKYHSRSVSESISMSPKKLEKGFRSRLSEDADSDRRDISPVPVIRRRPLQPRVNEAEMVDSANSSDSDLPPQVDPEEINREMTDLKPVQPVAAPVFGHQANDVPKKRPMDRPELRREKSRLSNATLTQLMDSNRSNGVGDAAGAAASAAWHHNGAEYARNGVTITPIDNFGNNTNSNPTAVLNNYPSTLISRKPCPMPSTLQVDTNVDADSASNYSSPEPKKVKPKLKIRGGERKIVGDPNIDPRKQNDILEIDFGVTERLTPGNSRPGTATGGRKSPFDHLTPVTPVSSAGKSSGQSSPYTPEKIGSHSRTYSHPWQPGAYVASRVSGALTPEEYVAQKTVLASRPTGYAPHRAQSSGKIEQIRIEQQRPLTPRKLQKRSISSRDTSVDFSGRMSAQELEHIARVTGGPLLNVIDRRQIPDPSIGLIGAIEAREQEKKNIKEGVQGQMVQATIEMRQRELRAQQIQQANAYYQQQGHQYGYGSQQYIAYPQTPPYPSPTQQQFYGQSMHQTYGQQQHPPSPSGQPQYYQNQYNGFYTPKTGNNGR